MNSIRVFRNAKNMSQTDLGNIVGCRRETISNLERGLYNPSWEMVFRIAAALDVCPCVLMLPWDSKLCKNPSYYLIE